MNKSELIARIVETTELTPAEAEKAIKAIIDTITKTLRDGDSVLIPGFGTFLVRERIARTGRNPKTGESIELKASKMPAFKAGKLLRQAAEGHKKPVISLAYNVFKSGLCADKYLVNASMSDAMYSEPPAFEKASKNYAVMNIFFATDRKEEEGRDIKTRFGSQRGEIKYGTTQVSIPRDHRMGEIESRSIWKLEFRDDPEKHVVVLDISTIDKSSFFKKISKKVTESDKKSAFIFVHGYNVTFEDAAKRTAQMSYDLGFSGAPVFYSWPSHGSMPKYPFDEENIQWAQTNIELFLTDFAQKSQSKNIYLIAHSMGNRALTRAYIAVINKNPDLKSRFTEIILAAPDIDADIFKRDIAPAMVKTGTPVTLYASSEDIPLKASKKFHGGYPRAGDSGRNLMVLSGVESIDATNVETEFLGHSYFADERSVISDMFYILNESLRASQRAGLNAVSSAKGVYWVFKR